METKVVELDLNDVLPNRFQPRIKFSEESIQELADSIKEHGVIQPIVVRNIGDKYEIIAGERRYKASVMAGKKTIPAIITDLNEKASAEVALIENVQRKDLTPIEEAISYKKILDMGYLTQTELASKLGKTQSTIANKLRLLNLDDDVQEALLEEKISERHARSLLKLSSQEKQKEMLKRIISERLTVRRTDEEIDKMNNDMNNNFNNGPVEQFNPQVNVVPTEPVAQAFVPQPEVFNPTAETLNVPTAPIVADTVPEVLPATEPAVQAFVPQPEIFNPTPVQPVMEQPVTPEVQVNPGFMDVNRIENEATDINVERPLAPVNDLLEPSNIPATPVMPEVAPQPMFQAPVEPVAQALEPETENPEELLVPGKFFNIMDEQPAMEQPSVMPNLEVPVEPVATPSLEPTQTFDYNFDINSLNNIEATSNLTDELSKIDGFGSNLMNQQPVAPVMPEVAPQPMFQAPVEPVTPAAPTSSEPTLSAAINMIRDLESKLESLGYMVDFDEMDFEETYQVIIKINKNIL